jgi:hypothetical protein
MALVGSLCTGLNAVVGFTNRSVRAQVTALLAAGYTTNQMSDHLAALRVNGIIERLPGTNTGFLTEQGQRVAILCTEVHDRLLRPLLAANVPPAPVELRDAPRTIDRHVRNYVTRAWRPSAKTQDRP